MSTAPRKDRRAFSESRPFVVHVENSRSLKQVFIVHQDQYEAALARHPDVARVVKTTWGYDAENYDESMKEADALVSYRFARDNLRRRAPHLKWIQVLGAGVDYMLPLDWVPAGLMLTTNWGRARAESVTVGADGDIHGNQPHPDARHGAAAARVEPHLHHDSRGPRRSRSSASAHIGGGARPSMPRNLECM